MKRLKHILPKQSLLLLYNALFLSALNYSSLIWGLNYSERITKLQKKAVRIICREKFNAHTNPLFVKLNILKFNDLIKLRSLQFYYKFANNMLPNHFKDIFATDASSHPYNTRHNLTSRPQVSKKVYTSRCIRYSMLHTIKNTPTQVLSKVHTHSLNGFTKYAKNNLISSYSITCTAPNCYVCKNNA